MNNLYDVAIIGGGFYGLRIALFLREELNVESVLVIEKEPTMMARASYVNQARVHNGYHYPRSILTAYRSAVNFPGFVDEYKDAVVNDFEKYYAISRSLSKVGARQFVEFCNKIGVHVEPAPEEVKNLFSEQLTEGVYTAQEYAFNSHILRDTLLERIEKCGGIALKNSEAVETIKSDDNAITVTTDIQQYSAGNVINCTYSQINTLHRKSSLPLVALKHEIAEMCLVKLPKGLEKFSVTVMDGPFFSIMPFPSRGLHTLSHVRYTPHESWADDEQTPLSRIDTHQYFAGLDIDSNYKKMYADVIRYIPALKDMELVDTISEVKTVLIKSEGDDSRPILFRPDFGIEGYTCIMGGKLDNIYDVFEELRLQYDKSK